MNRVDDMPRTIYLTEYDLETKQPIKASSDTWFATLDEVEFARGEPVSKGTRYRNYHENGVGHYYSDHVIHIEKEVSFL